MYSEEDLNRGIKAGIFDAKSVASFRDFIASHRTTPRVDEEQFKLLRGFNDIFVVIASSILLFSLWWISSNINPLLSAVVVSSSAWILSELFVRRRKMPLPAIILLLLYAWALLWGSGYLFEVLLGIDEALSTTLASTVSIAGVYIHWRRFHVPITVAIGMATFILLSLSLLIALFPSMEDYLIFFLFIAGLGSFMVAMHWDSQDTQRLGAHADIAFWLHLLSSPLLVHSSFVMLGVFDDQDNGIATILSIIGIYLLLSIVSLIIDRRIFMISALLYVLYAFGKLFDSYGLIDHAFALAGSILGLYLLLLSLFWQPIRLWLLGHLSHKLRKKLP
jgi:hypothetical protein